MKSIIKYLKKPWPYWVGGILLGVMNVILLGLIGISWQITSGFYYGVLAYYNGLG